MSDTSYSKEVREVARSESVKFLNFWGYYDHATQLEAGLIPKWDGDEGHIRYLMEEAGGYSMRALKIIYEVSGLT